MRPSVCEAALSRDSHSSGSDEGFLGRHNRGSTLAVQTQRIEDGQGNSLVALGATGLLRPSSCRLRYRIPRRLLPLSNGIRHYHSQDVLLPPSVALLYLSLMLVAKCVEDMPDLTPGR